MNKRLQAILNLIQESESLKPEEKKSLADAVKETDKEITITEFKLDRTEKVKRTTAILLEETIAELEQKRKSVEAQNRELEIEAALERVRSRSISMRQSSELGDLSFELVKQVQALGIATWHCAFNIYDEDQESSTEWGSNANGSYPIYKTPREGIFKRYYEIGQRGEALHVEVIGEDRCADHYAYLCTLPGVGETLVKVRDSGTPFPKSQIDHVAYFKYGYLLFITFEPAPEAHDIFKRFAKVFEQTYTRFLDLQKAEEQTRLAQIEVSLERVRARAMGMHHSDELSDVLSVLFDQFDVLGIRPVYTFLSLIDLDKNKFTYRQTGKGGQRVIAQQVIDLDRMEEWKDLFENMRAGRIHPLNCLHYPKESLEKVWEVFDEIYTALPEGSKVYPEDFPDGVYTTQAYCKFGYLGFDHTRAASEEDKDILQRFAKEFTRLYQRFLDLQKAEAQAKEAKIEAALERVRSRAMAMQTSEELNALIGTVFTELTKLDLVLTRCVIMTYHQKTNDARWWMANSEAPEQPMNFHVPYHEHPPNLAYFSAWRERTVKWIYPLEGKVKKQWDDFIFSETELRLLPDFVIAGMKSPDRVYLNASFYNSGNLTLASLEPLSDEHFDILIRFAKVFDLTYTRFNDLKQAEAQAWEAKIEAALERVRSRTMAMQRSEELLDVASILFQQVKALGVPQWNCGFNIWDIGDKEFTFYPGTPDGIISPSPCKIPLTEHPVFISFDESRKRGDELFVYEKEGEYQAGHYQYMLSLPGVGDLLQSMLDAGFQLPTFQIDHVANFSYGNLIFITFEHFPEMHDVFKRFAKVFEQTYTRFLDLKKAEAQAREAQIETALEKVRSRSLAMHKSDELQEVINTLFERLKELEIETDTAAILISKKGTRDIEAWIQNQEHTYSSSILLPYNHKSILSREVTELRENATDLISKNYSVVDKNDYFNHLFNHSDMKNIPESRKMFVLQAQGYTVSNAHLKHSGILLGRYADKPFSEGEHKILKRFAGVFEQAYIRFLDLQKAEAQAREAQIEASLERVRSKSMAMHKSEEILDVVKTMCDQFVHLGFEFHVVNIGTDFRNQEHDLHVWIYGKDAGNIYPHRVRIPYIENALLFKIKESLEKGVDFFSITLSKDEKDEFYQHLFSNTIVGSLIPDERKQFLLNEAIYSSSIYILKHTLIILINYNGRPFSEEHNAILKRFANVLEQSYTRFMDLQKAEAQAREAQIEASLERVRSKTMAMHNSQDVGNTVGTFFDELVVLGLEKSARCGIGIFDGPNDMEVWAAMTNIKGELVLSIGRLNMTLHPLLEGVKRAWSNKQQSFSYELQGDDLFNYYSAINGYPDYPIHVDIKTLPDKIIHNSFSFPDGVIFCFTSNSISENFVKVFKRFAGVFGQTYKRYLDLQKAEAQAREAQIEAALERTRTQSMLMQHSVQLDDTLRVFHEQVLLLGIKSAFSFLWLPDEKNDRHIFWAVWTENSSSEQVKKDSTFFKSKAINYPLDRNEPATAQCLVDWKSDQPVHSYHVRPADVENYFAAWKELLDGVEKLKPKYFQGGLYYVEAFMKYGCFGVMIEGEMPEDEKKILGRLAIEFERAYTRFLDLQKAEAQALEATIEASLEKVRGKAMAMHNSNDLTSTASLVFTELRKLGIDSFRSGVGLLSKENRKVKLFSATSSEEGGSLSVVGWAVLDRHPVLTKTYDSWINNEDYFPVLKGEFLKTYYEQVVSTFTVPVEHSEGYEQYGYFLPFSEGVFYGWSEKPYSDVEIKILHRFRAIVDLTFRRYMELQKSEENAIEAIRQASLDRVRAEIASMRTTADLDRITPLIWKELNILNIPFVRCGVFIMDKPQHKIHTFLSTPEGKAIAAFNLPYETSGNVGEILTHWQDKQTYISHWDEAAFSELGEQLVKQGAIPSKEVYMSTVPPGGIHLHCLPFLQGMLYVGNTTQLQESDIHLIQSVADAFSTAYARYEDFNKLESAKAQIEKTLTDLKQTQTLLVQSEKMASLGELTAGIAHEIQNPLNFVNNFSEVSNELLEEMKEEIEKGNYEEVQTLTNNIKQNLDKILHHGKRADGIVKGMLQHSRSSSGVKEPTDINALADEYLRLAYHGFRAKDKSFNASTNSDLDKSIGKINVVPQDIGRVVLNLITNAFYAVTEKQKQTGAEYQPTVSLSTKRGDDCVMISVKDNGNGIPEQIREKIFQPFFTTKPTGQGTGLGLSLSYDIVKAHGGELNVETKESDGSEFIIQLPSN